MVVCRSATFLADFAINCAHAERASTTHALLMRHTHIHTHGRIRYIHKHIRIQGARAHKLCGHQVRKREVHDGSDDDDDGDVVRLRENISILEARRRRRFNRRERERETERWRAN